MPDMEALASWLNLHYQYDPDRPRFLVALAGWHDPKREHDDHIHLQVHKNTTGLDGLIMD